MAGGIEGDLWSPAGMADGEQLPLLVVHDGPEYDALFLQSGSFFTPGSDAQERRFPYFERVVRFTAKPKLERPIPVTLTCGVSEENLDNNRLMTAVLQGHGYPATLHEVPGRHDWASWRNAFDPWLGTLLRQACQ